MDVQAGLHRGVGLTGARWRSVRLKKEKGPGWEPPVSLRIPKVWQLVGTSAQSYSGSPVG